MAKKAELQAEATELGVEFKDSDTIKVLENKIATAKAEKIEVDVDPIKEPEEKPEPPKAQKAEKLKKAEAPFKEKSLKAWDQDKKIPGESKFYPFCKKNQRFDSAKTATVAVGDKTVTISLAPLQDQKTLALISYGLNGTRGVRIEDAAKVIAGCIVDYK